LSVFSSIDPDLVRKLDVPGPRYTSYPTVPEWSTSIGAGTYGAHLDAAGGAPADTPLSLYVHLPFCSERCTFCGCNVVVTKDRRRADQYLDHVALELEMVRERLGKRNKLAQIHWGGGTPTFLDEAQIARAFREITRHFSPVDDAEIAIEIDPVVTTAGQLELLASLGFNRLSMGVQDFDPNVQLAINRVQTPRQTAAMLDRARRLGFRGINFDLIYGLPLQTTSSWSKTLDTVVAMSPDRMAVYSFAFVPEVRPHQRRLSVLDRVEGLDKLALFGAAYDRFTDAGYQAIGMDHFARSDDELARALARRKLTRSFQGYSIKAAPDVIAVGVTAIGNVSSAYFQNVPALAKYYAAIGSGRFATERGIELSADDLDRRAIIRDLMCNFFVDLEDRAARYESELESLRTLEHEGLVEIDGSRIRVTSLGRIFVRNIAMVFDAYLERDARRSFSRAV
jgi:oxygen-independent coproporphyrinogen-3 oxidase